MAKIFISFFNGIQNLDTTDGYAIPCFYETFCNGLKQYGNDVWAVMHTSWGQNFKQISQDFLLKIKEFDPDIIILFNNYFYDLSKDFDCPIIIYDVDSPLYFSNKDAIKNNPNRYIFFESQESSISLLKQNFNVSSQQILLLPFFTEIHAEECETTHNIVFIGTKFSSTQTISNFMSLHPTETERIGFLDLLKKIKDDPFLSQDDLLGTETSQKIINSFNKNEIISTLSAYNRNITLNAVADLGLCIWGSPSWGNDNYNFPYLNLSYCEDPVYSLAHNQHIYNSAKIGISVGHLQAKDGFPWRILDIMASNACLVTDYHDNFDKYFPNLKLPCFSNCYEARELCIKLLKDEKLRKDIVKQSQDIVDKNYRFKHTLKTIQEYLNINLETSTNGNLRLSKLSDLLTEDPPIKKVLPNIHKNDVKLSVKKHTHVKYVFHKIIKIITKPIYQKICTTEYIIRKLLCGIILQKEEKYTKKYYILGCLVYKRCDVLKKLECCLQDKTDDITNSFANLQDKINKLISQTSNITTLLLDSQNKINEQNNLILNKLEMNEIKNSLENISLKIFINNIQQHYKSVHNEICKRIKKGKKLRFGSYIVYDSTYGAHSIVDLMLKLPKQYDVKFVICPDVYRDKEFTQYNKTKSFFVKKYGSEYVLDGYDEETKEFIDWSGQFDVIYMANPYDILVNEVHKSSYLCKKEVLLIHLNYCFRLTKWSSNSDPIRKDSCFYYKYFVNTQLELRDIENNRASLCDNLVVSGYPKMDQLNNVLKTNTPRSSQSLRKKILLAPHHTVKSPKGTCQTLQLSNFLNYYDFITQLPSMYPDIDFIFRPHPLLFTNLIMNDIWSQQQITQYLDTLRSKNIIYSTESDYFHLFRDCDAIIHDCGSFMVEWLFTGKPCCFVVENEDFLKEQLNSEGLIAIEQYVLAKSREEICNFIDEVRNDKFNIHIDNKIREIFMTNYPNSSKFVLENIL